MAATGDSYRPAPGPPNDLPLASRLTFPNRDSRDRDPPGGFSVTRDSDLYRPDPDRPLPPRRTSPPPSNFPHLRHDGPPRRGGPEPFYPDRRDEPWGGPRGMRDDPRGPPPLRDGRPLMDRLGGRGQTARTFAEPMSEQAWRFDQVSLLIRSQSKLLIGSVSDPDRLDRDRDLDLGPDRQGLCDLDQGRRHLHDRLQRECQGPVLMIGTGDTRRFDRENCLVIFACKTGHLISSLRMHCNLWKQ